MQKEFDYHTKYFKNDLVKIYNCYANSDIVSSISYGVVLQRFPNEYYRLITGEGIRYLYRHEFDKID